MKTPEEILKDNIVNCHNRNTIFDTRNYIDYDNVIKALDEYAKQAFEAAREQEEQETHYGLWRLVDKYSTFEDYKNSLK